MLTLLLGVVILVAYTTQAMIGFGANIIALTLGAHLWPLDTLLPVVVALNLPLSGFLVWRYRQDVAWTTLLKVIAPAFGLGFVAGLLLSNVLRSQALALGFGVLVTAIALWELTRIGRPRSTLGTTQFAAFTLFGGLAQGLYASGGPFLAYAADRLQLSRAAFRATLLVVWLTTNSVLLLSFAYKGYLDGAFVKHLLWFLPLIAGGLWLGEKLHHAVSETVFRRGLYLVLLMAGVALILKQL